MRTIICEKFPRILKNKKRLEEALDIKIENRGKEIFIEGGGEEEYIAEKVIDALNLGFPFSIALLIKEEDFEFEILNIKDFTKTHNLERVRARIIGKNGKTLKTLSILTKCYFELKDNCVCIIGESEYMKNAQDAIIAIIQGSKHSNVYSYLEKNQVKSEIDLGLKNKND